MLCTILPIRNIVVKTIAIDVVVQRTNELQADQCHHVEHIGGHRRGGGELNLVFIILGSCFTILI